MKGGSLDVIAKANATTVQNAAAASVEIVILVFNAFASPTLPVAIPQP